MEMNQHSAIYMEMMPPSIILALFTHTHKQGGPYSEGVLQKTKTHNELTRNERSASPQQAPCRDIGMIRRLGHRTKGTTSAIGVASARASSIDGVPPLVWLLSSLRAQGPLALHCCGAQTDVGSGARSGLPLILFRHVRVSICRGSQPNTNRNSLAWVRLGM